MELTELTNQVTELRGRARAAELYYVHTAVHEARLESRSVTHVPHAAATLAVRLWLDDGRAGEASGPPDTLAVLADAAIARARAGEPDPHAGPISRQDRELGGLGIFDKRRDALTEEHRADVLASVRQSVDKAKGLTPGAFRYRDEQVVRRFASSRGVALEEVGTSFAVEGSARASSPDGDFELTERIASRRFSSVATLPLGEFLARRANAVRRDGETLPDGPVRVVFTPRAVAQLFAPIGAAFTAENMASEGFFLSEPGLQLDPRLHLVDDGALTGGLATHAFDERGVAPVALTLLRDGRPDGRFVSVGEARRHGVRPTGHQRNGALAPSNLVIKSGTRSVNALLAELRGPSLRVDDLPDLTGLDLRTGEVRLPVHGEVMEANKAVGSLRHARIEGSLKAVLGELVEVCNDTDRWGAIDAPALITQGWTLSTRG
ncbi:MAG: metallopeptidase TldD-related protein [Myxococcota bacterium]